METKQATLPNGITVKAMSCEMEDGRKGFFSARDKSEKKIREAAILVKHSRLIKSTEVSYNAPFEFTAEDGRLVKFEASWELVAWF